MRRAQSLDQPSRAACTRRTSARFIRRRQRCLAAPIRDGMNRGIAMTHRATSRTVSLDGRERAGTLPPRGRRLLDGHRRDVGDARHQAFHAGVSRPRELTHDGLLYRAYLRVESVSANGWGGPPRGPRAGPQDRVPAVSPGAQSRSVRQRRRTAAAARYRCGSIDLRIFATIVKFGSTTFAISYSAACPMKVCAPRLVIP